MSSVPRKSDSASRAPTSKDRSTQASTTPGILDAVRDQHGGRWIKYGSRTQAIWFAVADLISKPTSVFRRLSLVGVSCLTSTSQNSVKRQVEAHETFREALVAARPGWLEGIYVFGDGTDVAADRDEREVIVTFEPNRKFVPRGSLKEWQRAVAPFVAGQPLPFFVVALALSGPLLRHTPRGYLNPQVEIVSKGEIGKSTLGVLAASAWAGNPDADHGGGESWDLTLNSLDDIKLGHRDGFIFLDEGNLAGADQKTRREFAQQAVFKVATTSPKRRMGDPVNSEHARVALLSTTNTALADLVEDSEDVRHAAQSRMITIRIARDAPLGIFTSLPDGYPTPRKATEALGDAADLHWGAASRAFMAHLVQEAKDDEDGLKRLIAGALARYVRRDPSPPASARVQKTFALVAVAAAFAQRWSIVPKSWGSPEAMIHAVARVGDTERGSAEPGALDEVRAYVEQRRTNLIDVTGLRRPLTKSAFDVADGFLQSGTSGTEILIPAARFRAAFADHEAMMRTLRAEGRARTEGGESPKLTIKTPRSICLEGRVYSVRLDWPGDPALDEDRSTVSSGIAGKSGLIVPDRQSRGGL